MRLQAQMLMEISSSNGYNLIGNGDGSTGFTNGINGDQVGTGSNPINPLLGPLQNNGGSTETHALLAGSPAIDAGDPNFTPPPEFDQRGSGFPRVLDGDNDGTATVDIGAVELSTTTQVTNNNVDDVKPTLSPAYNSWVVYEHEYDYNPSDRDIQGYNLNTGELRAVADNSLNESSPKIFGNHVVYMIEDASDTIPDVVETDIRLYNLNDYTTKTVASSLKESAENIDIDIFGNRVAYEKITSASRGDIFLYNMQTGESQNITGSQHSGVTWEYNPQIVAGGQGVLYEVSEESPDLNPPPVDIYLYRENIETVAIANDPIVEKNPHGADDGNAFVYEYEYSSTDTDIYYYDRLIGDPIPLATSVENEINPHIVDAPVLEGYSMTRRYYATWQAWDRQDWEIYRYDSLTGNTIQITDNDYDDVNAQVLRNGFVVWEQEDGLESDIYLFNNLETQLLATAEVLESDPNINLQTSSVLLGESGMLATIAWQSWDGSDWEIYATQISPEVN
jgi:hypothetical protein